MSLYKRLHDVQQAPNVPTTAKRRDPVLDELRQKIHHHLIEELGPILYDKRLSEEDLRRRVHDQLHQALAQERAPSRPLTRLSSYRTSRTTSSAMARSTS